MTIDIDDLKRLQMMVQKAGQRIVVSFHGDGEKIRMSADFESFNLDLPPLLKAQAQQLAMGCLQVELEDFSATHRCSGYIMIEKDDVFLNGESRDNDWNYECSIDLDALEEVLEDAKENTEGPEL
jgi:hypothetical protein